MKTNKLNIFLLSALMTLGVTSCVQDDDFSTPAVVQNQDGRELPAGLIKTDIDAIKDAVAQDGFTTFENTNLYIEGYVVSSDESGNFFEELIIQDAAENPTAGIRVSINVSSLYNTYEFGRKVAILLDGLSAGEGNGVVSLGFANGSSVGQLQEAQLTDYIYRRSEVATIVAKEVAIADFSDELENTYIQLTNVQFPKDIALGDDTITYAGEASDSFDGERPLMSCETGQSVVLSTSTFSDFKSVPLATGAGNVSGILTRDFRDEFYTVIVNNLNGVDLGGERCDPDEISCGLATTIGATNIFADDFESQTLNAPISGNGWTNYIEAGTETWEAYTASGGNASLGVSARVGSFRSGDASTVAWLISPQIDLDAQEGETLRFQTSNSFADGSEMQVLFSRDWDGTEANITAANWGVLVDATIVQDSDDFGDWIESGNVDLSCETGTIYIAFKYTGSGDSALDGTYELDEISIDAN
ncbi:DUF5689 domain-containing protein [Aquimarina rhabdastrellae]